MSIPPADNRDAKQAFIERARFISTVLLSLFLLGWALWFWPYDDLLDRSGTPLGADFSMFYVAGQMTVAGETAQLYDQAAHQERLHDLFPGIDPQFALPYRYPPIVALLVAPLACLPYSLAIAVFMAAGLAAGAAGLWLLVRETGHWSHINRRLCYLSLFGWPVVLETWIGGQASLFAFLIVCTGIVLMQRERYAWAGAVWALAAYKPNVLLIVVIGCILFRPRVLQGLIPVGAIMLALTWWAVGWEGIATYIELTLQLAGRPWDVETPFWKVHSIAQWLTLLIGSQARLVALLLGLLATIGIVWRWRRTDNAPRSPLPYALLISVNALANPYTPIYDLTLLFAGLVLMAPTLATTGRYPFARHWVAWQAAIAAIYFGPHLSQLIAKTTGIQFFPLLLLGYAIFQARLYWLETRTHALANDGPPSASTSEPCVVTNSGC
jgi:hypothetical protein